LGKAKPDQVVVHRIDLQPSLKQSLDDAIMLNAATKTLSAGATAIAGIATGMGGLLAAGFGAYVAAWGAGQIADAVLDPIVEQNRANVAAAQIQGHGSVAAFVTSLNWSMPWEEVRSQWSEFLTSDLGQELIRTPPTGQENIMNRCFAFLSQFWLGRGPDQVAYFEGTGQFAQNGPKTPAEAWADWYPIEEAINDGVYSETGGRPYVYVTERAAQVTPYGGLVTGLLRLAGISTR
tara:strand:- start:67 stop:771 length:705 start_codon:yes stop_codon:yes gene_type:complete